MSKDKPKVIFVLGGPGSGKGTHCALLKKAYNFVHYSVGDILRQYIAQGTKQAKQISRKMKEGQMVSSKPIVEALKKKIQKGGNSNIYMVDGFPRNLENYEIWTEIIGDSFNVIMMLFIEAEDDLMKERILNRGKTSGRLDDKEEIIVKRIKTFHEETEPIIHIYKRKYKIGQTKFCSINAILSIQDAQVRIKKFIELNKIHK